METSVSCQGRNPPCREALIEIISHWLDQRDWHVIVCIKGQSIFSANKSNFSQMCDNIFRAFSKQKWIFEKPISFLYRFGCQSVYRFNLFYTTQLFPPANNIVAINNLNLSKVNGETTKNAIDADFFSLLLDNFEKSNLYLLLIKPIYRYIKL